MSSRYVSLRIIQFNIYLRMLPIAHIFLALNDRMINEQWIEKEVAIAYLVVLSDWENSQKC
jgi:hypothetical protein